MKRRINPLMVTYLILVFIPLALIATLITCLTIIIMVPLAGDKKWGYYPGRVWGRVMCALALVRVKVTGNDNYQPEQPYIFTANHQSIFDIFLVYGYLNAKFKWVMKQEIRKVPVFGKACDSMGHVFIDRSNPLRAQKSLNEAKQRLLQGGNSIFLFPEGTRTKTGKMSRFKRGAFSIAKDLHLPVVPVTIKGAYNVMPTHSLYIQPGTIEMIIHQPIDTTNLTDDNLTEMADHVKSIVESKLS